MAADPPCPWELWPLRNMGFAGRTQFFKKCNPQINIVSENCRGDRDPPMLLLYGLSTYCVFPPDPKRIENFCHVHKDFYLLGQLMHLFSQGLRQQSDSKVHCACERRGPGPLHGKDTGGRTSNSGTRLSPSDFLPKKILAEKPGIIYK